MDREPKKCSICNGELDDKTIIKLTGSCLVKCSFCGSWIYWPHLDPSSQKSLHNDSTYYKHPYFTKRRHVKNIWRTFGKIFSIISNAVDLEKIKNEKILDIGCDTGEFLLYAQKQYSVLPIGIDVSSQAIQYARKRGVLPSQNLPLCGLSS